MIYASIDIETTGLDPDMDQVLQVAVVIDGPSYFHHKVDELPHKVWRLKYDRLSGHPVALAMNADLLKRMDDTGAVTPAQFAAEFKYYLEGYLDDGRITGAGKNFTSFDRQFLRRIAPAAVKLIHHRSIDPGTLYADPADRCPPSTEDCLKRAGIKLPVTHDALDDARLIVRLIRSKWGGNQV